MMSNSDKKLITQLARILVTGQDSPHTLLAELRHEVLRQLLKKASGDHRKAAELYGVSRQAIQKIASRLELT